MKRNVIHTGDAFDVLVGLPDNCVACAITSPPYWGQRDYQVAEQLGVEDMASDYVDKIAEISRELRRIVNGSFWLNIADTYNGNSIIRQESMDHPDMGDERYDDQLSENREKSGVRRRSSQQYGVKRQSRLMIPSRIAQRLTSDGWLCRDEVIWSKPSPKPEGRVSSRLQQSHEKIYRFTTGENAYFDADRVDDRDVWRIATDKDANHPAPFPSEIPRRAILTTTEPGDVVLDPFCGIGTTLRTARELDREFVGIELQPEFAERARLNCGLTPDDPSVVRGDDEQHGLEAYADGGEP